MLHWELIFLFGFIAFIYSSVGFGGGSSYLALLSLYAIPFTEMRLIALVCNVIVVTGGVIIYVKHKKVNFKKVLPLVVLSVPAAYAGATLRISQTTFFVILGISLIVAAILLWVKTRMRTDEDVAKTSVAGNSIIGGAIGFLSGMVGIGGGIFLSPILNLMKWDVPKKIAATASVFILVNSLSGIAGQLSHLPQQINMQRILLLCAAVLVGGQLGSRIAAVKFNGMVVRRVTALLVFLAGVNVLVKHWPV